MSSTLHPVDASGNRWAKEAMIEQFSGRELRDPSELRIWRAIRRAAATTKLERLARSDLRPPDVPSPRPAE